MSNEILQDQESETIICYVDARTRPLFKEMLNKIGQSVKAGKSVIKYGDALKQINSDEFESLFNRWVSKCIEKNVMTKTTSIDCTKQVEWSQDMSEVERAYQGMEILKEMM